MPDETQQPAPEQTQSELTPENPVSEPNPAPVSPDEPMEPAPIQTEASGPTEMPPELPQASPSPESAILDKDQNPANEPLEPAFAPENTPAPENPNVTVEKRGNDVTITEVMEPTAHSETATAQMAGNEPFDKTQDKPLDLAEEIKKKQRQENLKLANEKRQEKKKEKINEIMILFSEKSEITNDEVEKLLHVSDATATRYLETLEKEGKIKQVGKTGKGVSYIKI